MSDITIRGPHGAFEICRNSGHMVSAYGNIPAKYKGYSSCDVNELKTWCDRQGMEVPNEVPILCIGLHRYDGKFDAPVEEYREEWLYQLRNGQPLAA